MGFRGFCWVPGVLASIMSFYSVAYFLIHCVMAHSGLYLLYYGDFTHHISEYYLYDSFSFYMTLGSIFFVMVIFSWSGSKISDKFLPIVMLSVSVGFSIVSFCCHHALLFWGVYELTILPLLFLVLWWSPYSERYTAFVYFSSYLFFTSLPVLVGVLWFSMKSGHYNASLWVVDGGYDRVMMLLMGVAFITKIPLPPFHVWLPLVHAEASTAVSICLSGYVMKMGVFGIFRLCGPALPDKIFSYPYVCVVLLFSLVFFFSAVCELDGKRWLAFLSLGHIAIVPLGVYVMDFSSQSVVFIYCLGHGLSAALGFKLLSILGSEKGSRNWLLLKGANEGSGLLCHLLIWFFVVVSGFPFTLQFFGDVTFIILSKKFGYIPLLLVAMFIFLSGIIPMVLLGGLVVRRENTASRVPPSVLWGLPSLVVLGVWNFGLFLLC
uniref:NADH-ubiquinone oxidoreductase chain 4 n=1 Tax=Tanaisia sp. SS-2020 TaxID=2780549 RepID=A0A894JN42_9TREM|nr:NADH dehydrogenase subunit 4 [Tanaisia sp. SS-2020]